MPDSHQSSHRVMQTRHLAEAERHVVQGERHIAEQVERVAELTRDGHDVTEARKLLTNLYTSQALFVQHRDQILRELEE
jgi:hypothetical protein